MNVELTLLDLDLLRDSDHRLTASLNQLREHLVHRKDFGTVRLLLPIIKEMIDQAAIIDDAIKRAVDPGSPAGPG